MEKDQIETFLEVISKLIDKIGNNFNRMSEYGRR